MNKPNLHTLNMLLLFLLLALTVGVSWFGYRRFSAVNDELSSVRNIMASTTDGLENENQTLAQQVSNMRNRVVTLNEEITDLNNQLDDAEDENDDLEDELDDERDRNDELAEQVEEVTSSFGTLQTTVATDPELLRKYSRTYFLSENYRPESLAQIDDEYLYDDSSLTVLEQVWPYLEDLLEAADDDGVNLLVTSAYRPFNTQQQLNDSYTRTYGTGANQFSAEQGYSEHQLGTTIDFVTEENGGGFGGFENTRAFEWLQENAHEYGFVLSYPEGNSFYQYEPWHWRFVGEELAGDLDDENAYFYQWDQREIDSYRSQLFD